MADVISTSGAIHFSGLGNGTDFDAMITKLVDVEKQRITSLETWKSSWTDKMAAFEALNTSMLSLKTTLEGMDTMGEFLTKTVTSANSGVLTATAGAAAEVSNHTVEVNKLAQNKVMSTTSGYATDTEDINVSNAAVNFTYVYQGTTHSVSIPATCSLKDLRDIINVDGTNPGVKASIVNDGTNYYLQFRGMDMGADNTLTIASNSGLANFGATDFSTVQVNQDAEVRLDGWPAGSWITRSSNTITDLVDGLTINLKEADPGFPVSLDVSTDLEAVKENINTFINQVNVVRKNIQILTKVDKTAIGAVTTQKNKTAATRGGSILTGNYGLQMIDSRLKDIVSSKGLGFDYSTDTFSSLSQVGITTDAQEGSETQGLLVLNAFKLGDTYVTLEDALAEDPEAVARLFAAQDLGGTNSTDFSFGSDIPGITKAGEYEVSYTISGGAITSATINGHEATISGNLITGKAGYDESGLELNVINMADGAYSGKASLKQGKCGELVDALGDLTNENTGPLAILQDNYKDITTSIDNKIDYEDKRIKLMEARLRTRYARLDATLGTYDKLSAQLKSQIAQLSSSSS